MGDDRRTREFPRDVRMTERQLREHALDWFRRGFSASGVGCNGETLGVAANRAPMAGLLEQEFERQWLSRFRVDHEPSSLHRLGNTLGPSTRAVTESEGPPRPARRGGYPIARAKGTRPSAGRSSE